MSGAFGDEHGITSSGKHIQRISTRRDATKPIDSVGAARKTTDLPPMWKPFKCRLFREHDYQLRREPRAMYLQCRRCGHRSSGWLLPQERLRRDENELRLFMADADTNGDAVRVVAPANGNGNGNGNGAHTGAMPPDREEFRLTFAEPR